MKTLTREQILNAYEEGNVVFYSKEGPQVVELNEFINNSSDDILKELSRTEKIILKMEEKNPESLKWVNDYALVKVIEGLKNMCDNMSSEVLVESETTPEDVEAMKKEIQKLNDAITAITEAKDTEIENVNSRLEKAKEVFAESKKEIAEFKIKYDEINNLNISLNDINEKLKNELEKAKYDLTKTEGQLDAYKHNAEDLNEKIKLLNEEIEELKNERNNAVTQIKTLSKQNTELQAEIDKPITLTIEKNPTTNARMVRMGDNLISNFNSL